MQTKKPTKFFCQENEDLIFLIENQERKKVAKKKMSETSVKTMLDTLHAFFNVIRKPISEITDKEMIIYIESYEEHPATHNLKLTMLNKIKWAQQGFVKKYTKLDCELMRIPEKKAINL